MDTAPTEIYTLSYTTLFRSRLGVAGVDAGRARIRRARRAGDPHRRLRARPAAAARSEEHTSELQSPSDLVCRLLLEKKKNTHANNYRDSLQKMDRHDIA